MGRYRIKSEESVEAIQWTGDMSTIENEYWGKKEIENGNIIFAVNGENDTEAKLIYIDHTENKPISIEKGDYLVYRSKYKYVYGMNKESFEKRFEIEEEKKSIATNNMTVNVNLDMSEVYEALNKLSDRFKGIADAMKDNECC